MLSEPNEMNYISDGLCTAQVIFSVVNAGMRPEVPEDMPPAFSALMEACWQTDADSRCYRSLICVKQ